jgi:hypothetical protein
MAAPNPYDELRLSIRNAPSPTAALLKELAELGEALPHAAPSLPAGADFSQLRAALDSCAEALAHECRRCLLVYLDAETEGGGALPRSSLGGTAGGIAEAAARLVAVVQALGTYARLGLGGPLLPGACFCEDMRGACSGLLRAVADFVEAAQACSGGGSGGAQKGSSASGSVRVAGCKQRLAGPCAKVAQWSSENVRRVPKTLGTAVKRRFLACTLTLKSSATDLRAETGVAAPAAGGSGGAATAAAAAAAAAATATAAAASAAAGGGGGGGASASALPAAAATAEAIVHGTVALFRAQTALLACASALADVAVPQPQPQLGGGGSASTASAGQEGGGAEGGCHLDALACACRPLEEAVIDFASAVSDAFASVGGRGGEEGEEGGDWGEELGEGEEEEELEGEEGEGEEGEERDEDLSSPADKVAAAVGALQEALAPLRAACEGLHRAQEDLLLRMEGLGVDTAAQLEALHAGSAQCREAEGALRQHLGAALQLHR